MAPHLARTIAELLRRAPAHAPPPVSIVAQTQRTAAGAAEADFLHHCRQEGLVATELKGREWVSPQGPVRCFVLRRPRDPSRLAARRRAAAAAALAVLMAPLLAPSSALSTGWAQAAFGRLSDAGRSTLASATFTQPALHRASPAAVANGDDVRNSPCAAVLLSQRPRVYLLRGLISREEAAALIQIGTGRMQPSQLGAVTADAISTGVDHPSATNSSVGGADGGGAGGANDGSAAPADSRHRSSSSLVLSSAADTSSPLVSSLRRRWSDAARLPLAMAEPTQLTRYAPGEAFGLHMDADPTGHVPRAATLLTYLSDGFGGGETVFPRVEHTAGGEGAAPLPHLSKLVAAGGEALLAAELARGLDRYCGPSSRVLRVAPRAGDAILFFPLAPDLTVDLDAVHGGCPPVHGGPHKWIAQQWFNLDPAQAGGQAGRGEPSAKGAEALTRRATAAALGRLREGWSAAAPADKP
jgi:prolyl 4-hydroxylase